MPTAAFIWLLTFALFNSPSTLLNSKNAVKHLPLPDSSPHFCNQFIGPCRSWLPPTLPSWRRMSTILQSAVTILPLAQ
ncbi:hypothetical protein SEVIR_4G243400v4 [Setaria viridis]|uniref:Secreted protein n=1 Tax=Setaria viridis TaxID=4556 RepID=A0A4U6VEZ5_SETVI|nr:hypothetical protein SEVIR_4G243400v2 [Setaria viridis]